SASTPGRRGKMGRTEIGRARGGRSDEGRSIVGIGTDAASAAARTCTSPKRWTPAQLATHLNTTGASEAGAWAATHNVGGRAFMRMGEELRGMG
ncbi:hypothetical protein K438DRAFT_1842745, partial [Mycena galopus ATCC 62051]